MVWQVVEDAKSVTPSRTRRQKASLHLRNADGVILNIGDSITFNDDDDVDFQESGLIIEIDHTIDPKIIVLMYNESDDIDNGVDDHELLLTPVRERIQLKNIKRKLEVMGGNSNADNSFYCKRASNETGSIVKDLDYHQYLQLLKDDVKEAVEFIRDLIMPSKLPKKPINPFRSPSKSSTVKYNESSDEDEDDDDDEDDDEDDFASAPLGELDELDDDDNDHVNDDDDDDDEFTTKSSPKKRKLPSTPKKPKKAKSATPKAPKTPKSAKTPKVATPRSTKSKVIKGTTTDTVPDSPKFSFLNADSVGDQTESIKFIKSVLGKKTIRIANALPTPNFQLSSPRSKRRESKEGDYKLLDTKSPAFKDLKQKLHTATKLQSLPCREDEFTSLYLYLESAIRQQTGGCLYISGTPGIGKTATIREVMNQLSELKDLGDINDFNFIEINALKLISPNYAYEVLWSKISGLNVSPANAALFLEAYFKEESVSKKPLVVMVDELDQIATKKQNVMYNFFNWPTYPHSKLIVIAVANTMDLPERVLLNKISSRLGLHRLQFIGYTFEQLGYIIEHRLEMLTRQNKRQVVIEKDAISFASRKVSSVSGDARRALQICRRAVEIAELEYLQSNNSQPPVTNHDDGEDDDDVKVRVKISHISKAINETINSPIAQYVASLSYGSKLILVAILIRMNLSGLSENPLGEILDQMRTLVSMTPATGESKYLGTYDVVVSQPKSIRIEEFRFLYLELVENGIILSQNIKSERYKLISLNVSREEILMTLRRDPQVSHLVINLKSSN